MGVRFIMYNFLSKHIKKVEHNIMDIQYILSVSIISGWFENKFWQLLLHSSD